MLGSSFVIAGVALIVVFAPNQPCPLTAGRFSHLLAQPGAIALLVRVRVRVRVRVGVRVTVSVGATLTLTLTLTPNPNS